MLGMMPPKKKLASVILASKGMDGKETEEKMEEIPTDDSVGMEACAEKMMKAIESKDKMAFIEGLKDFFAMMEIEEEVE